MEIENPFMQTVLNSVDEVEKFLISNGNSGKPVCPIYFFSEDDKDKFVKKDSSKI